MNVAPISDKAKRRASGVMLKMDQAKLWIQSPPIPLRYRYTKYKHIALDANTSYLYTCTGVCVKECTLVNFVQLM